MTIPTALAGNHTVVPPPFAPGSLNGLSERMISSHHENNYGGAVRNLNRAEQELSHLTADTPPFVVAALRDQELTFRNSKTLHEAYFANLGGDGRRSGAIEAALARAYGSTTRWEQHIHATGMGLGGGSGWAIALRAIAEIVHDIDLKDGKFGRAETAGVQHIVNGVAMSTRGSRAPHRCSRGCTRTFARARARHKDSLRKRKGGAR